MKYANVVKHYGGVTQAARELGFTRAAIYSWRRRIPIRTQRLIEAMTGGKLRAKVNGK